MSSCIDPSENVSAAGAELHRRIGELLDLVMLGHTAAVDKACEQISGLSLDPEASVVRRAWLAVVGLRQGQATVDQWLPVSLELHAQARRQRSADLLLATACLLAEVKRGMQLHSSSMADRAEALTLCESTELGFARSWAAANYLGALQFCGLQSRLLSESGRILLGGARLSRPGVLYVLNFRGSALYHAAENSSDADLLHQAIAVHQRTLEVSVELAVPFGITAALCNLGICSALIGDLEAARRYQQRASGESPATGVMVGHSAAWLGYLDALIEFSSGRVAQGRAVASRLWHDFHGQRQKVWQPMVKLLELLLRHPDPERAGSDVSLWARELASLYAEQYRDAEQVAARSLDDMARATEIALQNDALRQQGDELMCKLAQRNEELSAGVAALQTEMRRRQHAEEQLLRANAELEQRVIERTEQLQRVQVDLLRRERAAALGRLLAGVAHRLNTPLGNALTAASSVRDFSEEFDAELERPVSRRRLAEFIQSANQGSRIAVRALEQASELIRLFMQLSVLESPEMPVEFELVALVRQALAVVPAGIPVHFEPPQACVIRGRPQALSEVLQRLLDNAVRHGQPQGGTGGVWIELVQDEETVRLQVRDRGLGMSAERLRHLLDPLSAPLEGESLGLGLPIAYRLCVEVMNGDLRVSSKLAKGSCFELVLPLDLEVGKS